jgi:hypothetical protein
MRWLSVVESRLALRQKRSPLGRAKLAAQPKNV